MYKYVFDINIEYHIIPVNNVINKLVYINKYSNISIVLYFCFLQHLDRIFLMKKLALINEQTRKIFNFF